MITKIELTNFQSHQNTVLELGGFTAITGQSSSGKSSVIRGLNWLFYGDWDALFPADPAKPTAVAITLEDGTRIVRMRQDKNNRAAIVQPGHEPLKFKDFGEEIPGLFNIINMRKIQMGDRSVNLNISDQDEPLFLVNTKHWSKPARAQWLGRLYGAHVVNTMLRLMAADKKDFEKQVRDLDESVAGLTEKRKSYDNLPAQEAAVDAAEAMRVELLALAGIVDGLAAFRARVQVVKQKKWVMEVDTAGMRLALQELAVLGELKARQAKVAGLRQKVQEKGWMRTVDTQTLRAALGRLSSFIELRDRASQVRITEAKVAAKAKLSSFDTQATRASLDRAVSLSKLRTDLASFGRSAKALKDKAWLKKMDPAALKADALLLANLEIIRGDKTRTSLKLATTTLKLQGKERDLKEAYNRAGENVFSGGDCPLCASSGVQVPPAQAVERVRNFMGVPK